ncbi:hypothetical protein Naga_100265g9 [Nannochloropsis gaditana]|uniref:Uncharacterized protein n=2 Tax=Ochrophyta TaxID=2696291 RepID=W7TMZ1_9STRA|nr:hypothetical protein Naga_100265g9 [Nannochloropsis gaditana]|eukprot:CAMPEP_0185785802 /NCGR_PEP_ID=MMETSP1174-20130828/131596_1 /TAXON_ID=35687 /ORGANISM="Dictyocha speculum, Strain CCMP1381" /LENGTH=153 /DNA_ID=CAMNT_0028478055 /DNA_START=53 /DNA_END=514 /DNA_ORIENTATION=+
MSQTLAAANLTSSSSGHGMGGLVLTKFPIGLVATSISKVSSSALSTSSAKAPQITLTATPMPLRAELKRRNSHPLRLAPRGVNAVDGDEEETLSQTSASLKALIIVFTIYTLIRGWNGFVEKGMDAAVEAVQQLVMLVVLVVGVAPLLDQYFF